MVNILAPRSVDHGFEVSRFSITDNVVCLHVLIQLYLFSEKKYVASLLTLKKRLMPSGE